MSCEHMCSLPTNRKDTMKIANNTYLFYHLHSLHRLCQKQANVVLLPIRCLCSSCTPTPSLFSGFIHLFCYYKLFIVCIKMVRIIYIFHSGIFWELF